MAPVGWMGIRVHRVGLCNGCGLEVGKRLVESGPRDRVQHLDSDRSPDGEPSKRLAMLVQHDNTSRDLSRVDPGKVDGILKTDLGVHQLSSCAVDER